MSVYLVPEPQYRAWRRSAAGVRGLAREAQSLHLRLHRRMPDRMLLRKDVADTLLGEIALRHGAGSVRLILERQVIEYAGMGVVVIASQKSPMVVYRASED